MFKAVEGRAVVGLIKNSRAFLFFVLFCFVFLLISWPSFVFLLIHYSFSVVFACQQLGRIVTTRCVRIRFFFQRKRPTKPKYSSIDTGIFQAVSNITRKCTKVASHPFHEIMDVVESTLWSTRGPHERSPYLSLT